MPKASEMRFALGQIAYHLYGCGFITRVKIKAWSSGNRGGKVTYKVKTVDSVDSVAEDIPDSELYHAQASAEAAYQEHCASRIAYYQHQVNMWKDTASQGCELTDNGFVEDD